MDLLCLLTKGAMGYCMRIELIYSDSQSDILTIRLTTPYGGECGIRTHGRVNVIDFQDQRNRPLYQLSMAEQARLELARQFPDLYP